MARCSLACIDSAETADGIAALAEHAERIDVSDYLSAHWALSRAIGEHSHLAATKHLLDERLAAVPEEVRGAVRTSLRDHRDLLARTRGPPLSGLAAWEAAAAADEGSGSAPELAQSHSPPAPD